MNQDQVETQFFINIIANCSKNLYKLVQIGTNYGIINVVEKTRIFEYCGARETYLIKYKVHLIKLRFQNLDNRQNKINKVTNKVITIIPKWDISHILSKCLIYLYIFV